MKENKKGNVIIFLGIIITVLMFMAIFVIYYQVNTITKKIRQDLFYASNNAIIAMDKEELLFSKYILNTQKAKNIIQEILVKNHIKDGGSITDILVEELCKRCGFLKRLEDKRK